MGRVRVGPAKRPPGAAETGSILLDVLVTLLIASTALLVTLGSIALTARAAGRVSERVAQLVSARNEDARGQTLRFTGPSFQQ